MPRRWSAEPATTAPGRLTRLEKELHRQWATWKAERVAKQEARATQHRLNALRKKLTWND